MKRYSKTVSGLSNTNLLLKILRAPTHSCSDSPEVMEIQTVDGRVITVASSVTQTDWDWVLQRQQKDSSSGHLNIHIINIRSESKLQAIDILTAVQTD